MKDTKQQFEHVIAICRDLFAKKLHDYGAAWRIMRPSSVTDQIFIKANRIRSIETKGVAMVDEGIRSEFIAIVNYGIYEDYGEVDPLVEMAMTPIKQGIDAAHDRYEVAQESGRKGG